MEQRGKKRILVVEDEKALSKALEMKLEKEGFEVVLAFDGEEGVENFKKGKYDLVLLDIIMPKKNGFQVLEEIRKLNTDVPVMISTNLSQGDDLERAKSLGANYYFVKSDTSIADVVVNIRNFLKHEDR